MSNFTLRFLSCEFSAAREASGKRAKRAERGEERGRAGEERRGKKLTALIWNQKGECSLAVTQILHLHLYKTGSPVSLSGSLFPHPPPHSPFFISLPFTLLFLCTVARGVVIFGMFSVLCALLCVLIVGHPSGGVMRRTCLRAAVPGCAVGLSMELQTPGPPEGQEEGGLGFVSTFLLLPSLRFLFDLSLTFTLFPFFFLSPLSWSQAKNSCSCCLCAGFPPFPPGPVPSITAELQPPVGSVDPSCTRLRTFFQHFGLVTFK